MASYKSPKFILHVFITLFSIALFLTPIITQRWPQFCTDHNWAFFNTVGVVISLMIISFATLISVLFFEDSSWLLYFLLLLSLGGASLASGAAFLTDTLNNCAVNDFPLLRSRSDEEVRNKENQTELKISCPLDVLLALLPLGVIEGGTPIENKKSEAEEEYNPYEKKEINTATEKFVAYSLFGLGIVFILLSFYFLIRRDCA